MFPERNSWGQEEKKEGTTFENSDSFRPPFSILLMLIRVACYWSLVFDLQEDDVIQDRFIVHGDQYRAVREGLAKTVISGNIQDIVTAITVSVNCVFLFSIVPSIFVINEWLRTFQS